MDTLQSDDVPAKFPSVPSCFHQSALISDISPDPALCLTPDKSTVYHDRQDITHTPKQVRFDVPPSESCSSESHDFNSFTPLEDSLNVTDASELDETLESCKENLPSSSCEIVQIDHSLDITVDESIPAQKFHKKVLSAKNVGRVEEKNENNVLKDHKLKSNVLRSENCLPAKSDIKRNKNQRKTEIPICNKKHGTENKFVGEHVLKNPEFQTTLKVSKEIQQLKTKDLDVSSRLESKLKKLSIKTELEEKGLKKLCEVDAFTGLPSLELPEEELLKRKELNLKKTVEAANKVTIKPKEQKVKEPDLMEFFTPDLLVETASLTIEGLPSFQPTQLEAPVDSGFKLYKHLRCWDNCASKLTKNLES